jgi:hypothetical protein
MNKIKSGHYINNNKFAGYGSIAEDSIYYHTMLAEQADAKRRMLSAQALGKGVRV